MTKLMRKMRHYNNVPNNTSFYNEGYRNLKLTEVIEDPVFRNSQNSLLHQMNDVVAYCLRQRYEPNNYMKRKGGHNFYNRISDVVLKEARNKNQIGIVEL